MTTITARATGRSLVSDDLFTRLTRRIVEDEGIDQQFAERIMNQALVFLKACAENHRTRLAPSKSVDIGWHMFVLHTRDYAEIRDRLQEKGVITLTRSLTARACDVVQSGMDWISLSFDQMTLDVSR